MMMETDQRTTLTEPAFRVGCITDWGSILVYDQTDRLRTEEYLC